MRIPTSKLYRAFPELDEFTDEQCEALMRRIRASVFTVGAEIVLILFVMFVVFVACCVSLGVVMSWLNRWDVANSIPLIAFPIAFLVPPAAVGVVLRDLLLRRRIRRSLQVTLLRLRCPACQYLLLGQWARDGAVTCPECGRKTLLIDLGITEADLIPPTQASVPLLKHD